MRAGAAKMGDNMCRREVNRPRLCQRSPKLPRFLGSGLGASGGARQGAFKRCGTKYQKPGAGGVRNLDRRSARPLCGEADFGGSEAV